MDPKPFCEQVLSDDGLTDGLADEEARILIDWLVDRVEAMARSATGEQAAWEATTALTRRARRLAKVAERLCYDEDLAEADRLWSGAGHYEPLTELRADDPVAVVRQLIQWEEKFDA